MATLSYTSFYFNLPIRTFCIRWCACLFLLFAVHTVFAEGSKEVTANGGYRAYLFSSTVGNLSFPFPTLGTMKVYVKAGETINVGSSAQGLGGGTINFRVPDGSIYTSGTSTTIGLIANRSQELAGPLPNAGGYAPFALTVKSGQDGVWEIDFVSPDVANGFNPDPIAAAANWTQGTGQYISAFDVTVRNAAAESLTGRVFTNVFSGILGAFNIGFNGIFNILTKDGYQYTMNNNGQAGNGFTFFVNNKGFRTATGAASYQSGNTSGGNVQDPRAADTQSDITHKIFFNTPAADLPASAKTPGGGTTWLLSTPLAQTVSTVSFIGAEGTIGRGGTSPLGGNFTFTGTVGGTYTIAIDVNRNGVFTDPIDRILTGNFITGINQVFWDGLDGLGNKVPGNNLAIYATNISLATTAGEVHFPFFDTERNVNGIILTRTNGSFALDDTVYWDDTPIVALGTPSNPLKNLTGISSSVNGHKWGTATSNPADDADFGNNKSIDTWSYIKGPTLSSTTTFYLQEADLQVLSLVPAAGCAGQSVTYTIAVINNGPNDVTGSAFRFNYPVEITNVVVTSAATTGTSTLSAGAITTTAYTANLDLPNGAVRTFTITGRIAQSATGNLPVSASIMRPADMTDPDATNPDAAPPTDAANECNSLPSGAGCNNIIAVLTVFSTTPNAGADQTVFQYTQASISATNSGTWTQVATDPVAAIISTSAGSTTTITGLNTVGLYHFINTNINGCADTVALNVIPPDMEIPNIFTPNDDGKNDVFKLKDLESYPGSQLIVFNRWGNEVYRSDNYLNNWNGSNLAEGTYYYLLNRREHSGAITPIRGWVFLKRKK
jgi:gliding motility-associated-like protein